MNSDKLQKLLNKARQKREDGITSEFCSQQFSLAYKSLNVPASVRKVAHEISPIGYERRVPFLLPPAAVPLWRSLGDIVVCEWRHWNTSRKPTIVRFYPGYGMAVEWARNYSQLSYLVLQNILTAEAELNAQVEEVARVLEIEDLSSVFEIWERFGDRPRGFSELHDFSRDLPQSCFEGDLNEYQGDFPTSRTTSPEKLKETSSFELHGRFASGFPDLEIRKQVQEQSDCPNWLSEEADKNDLFWSYSNAGDAKSAWMTLASTGWNFKDAKEAILSLSEWFNDLKFSILAETWSAQSIPDNAVY